jgi:hypothetical protein
MSQSSKREKENNASRKPRFADNNEPKGSPNAAYKYSSKDLVASLDQHGAQSQERVNSMLRLK